MSSAPPPPPRRFREDPFGDEGEWRQVGDPKKMPTPSKPPAWLFVGIPTLTIVVIILAFVVGR